MDDPEPFDAPLPEVVGDSPAMREVYRLTRLVAPTRANVLLVGETGTGKELIAKAVHRLSGHRAEGPYVRVNCGALSESLLESELFGHVKGAFTGALDNKTGRFEAAHGGTIFLDEISSMSFKLQVKLLRVLQENEFERVGESRTIRVDTRVVAATNVFLEDEIEAGRFRDDLYYRLNVVPIHLPPLRERREDIPSLIKFFLQRKSEENRRDPPTLPTDVMKAFLNYDYPGNVRELENLIERAVVLANGQSLTTTLLGWPGRPIRKPAPGGGTASTDLPTLIQQLVRLGIDSLPEGTLKQEIVDGIERELIEQVMRQCKGVQVSAAKRLGINRNTLHKKLDEYAGKIPPEPEAAVAERVAERSPSARG
ncbi:MAG: sigma-54-dependent Fis family transcriptional regulator [Planctomycetia bacterium]|nr:sigma-54-dependent Fis family transcriptional regulator [Planctomycetia bacterium]